MIPQNELKLIIVAEDNLAGTGLEALISELPGCVVVGQSSTGGELTDDIEIYQPDVIVWDLGLNPSNSLERLAIARESGVATVVLAPDEDAALAASFQGVRCILTRNAVGRVLLSALRAAMEGLTVISPDFSDAFLSAGDIPAGHIPEPLTARETEVLQLVAQGMTNKAIAFRLSVSEHTIKFHVNSILGKLGARSRTEAVTLGTRLGVIKL